MTKRGTAKIYQVRLAKGRYSKATKVLPGLYTLPGARKKVKSMLRGAKSTTSVRIMALKPALWEEYGRGPIGINLLRVGDKGGF